VTGRGHRIDHTAEIANPDLVIAELTGETSSA
jgi:DNA-directed RNA polymerase alpha subunit